MGIPLIDLAGALQVGAPRGPQVAAQLREACMGPGFFYVTHHGVPHELIAQQFALATRFFDLPLAEKQAISLHQSSSMRGYESLGGQTLDATARPDLKESFYCGLDYPADHPYVQRGYHSYGTNQWPAPLPTLAPQCRAYIAAMQALALRLMQLMALSLDLPEDYFDHTHQNPMLTLRLLRYPPHPVGADALTFGAGEHTDWGAITVLAQDHPGGLEVKLPSGEWVAATPVQGALVVNLGDMIPRWTNGVYRSNPHRVRNVHSAGAPRHSIPFFYTPDYEAQVSPVATCVPAGENPRFAPCTVGEHLQAMYQKTYGLQLDSKTAVMA
jgi:isopenicillin N synthase-like dioxygenase